MDSDEDGENDYADQYRYEDLKTVNETRTQAVQPTSNFDPSPVNQSTDATLMTILQTMQHQVLLQCEEQRQQREDTRQLIAAMTEANKKRPPTLLFLTSNTWNKNYDASSYIWMSTKFLEQSGQSSCRPY